MRNAYGKAWKSINSELGKLTTQIKAAKAAGETVNATWLLRQRRLESVERTVAAEIRVLVDLLDRTITDAQMTAAFEGRMDAAELIRESMGVGPGGGMFDPVIPRLVPEELIRRVAAGTALSKRLEALGADAVQEIRQGLLRGVLLGKNPREVARGIRSALDGNRWRANVIARTEMLGVYRQAASEAYKANDVVEGWIWSSAQDDRTCEICWAEDGSVHKDEETLSSHPCCFVAGVLVGGPRAEAATTRYYEGTLVILTTIGGVRVPVTPNHPLLTRKGWLAAGDLREGDYLIRDDFAKRVVTTNPDDKNMPTRIEQVADALRLAGNVSSAFVPSTSIDFHGDGFDSNVDVVWANRFLESGAETALLKPTCKGEFGRADSGLPRLPRGGTPSTFGKSLLAAPRSGIRGGCVSAIFSGGALTHHQPVGFDDVAPRNPAFNESAIDNTASDAERLGKAVLGLTSLITADEVVNVERVAFHGLVYNLQTQGGWYSANGIIAHNCRCAMEPVTQSWESLGFKGIPESVPARATGATRFAKLPPTSQRKILGPGKFDLYKSGKLKLSDLPVKTRSDFGPGLRTKSLKELAN
ncbi:MAG: phage minor head protein [Bacteroidales bacterium]|nr:phage minor head protein [Bacteroidales bacterium]